ncbi:MAG: hypothetical protein KDD53_02420 [Bdellovibrionales bacterium]|nr:hypothetical protein [Bdellovibrionales bacterium]
MKKILIVLVLVVVSTAACQKRKFDYAGAAADKDSPNYTETAKEHSE